MSLRNPERRLCVSVAGKSVGELTKKVKQARQLGAGYIEFRIDYLEDQLDDRILGKIRELFNGDEIITLRKRAEGGRFMGGERERISLIRRILHDLRPRTIDVEIDALKRDPRLVEEVEASRTRLIASYHSLRGSPVEESLGRVLNIVPKVAFAAKLVCRANVFRDNLTILSMYGSREAKQIEPTKLIAFCVGELGVYSRIKCLSFGSPISYVSLPDEAVAPGQLDLITMKETLAQRV